MTSHTRKETPMSTTPTSTEPNQPAATKRWTVDPARSSVEFRVSHFWGLITVAGHFDRFDGTYTDRSDSRQIELTIDADSVDTGRRQRDKHLRSADFFDVAAHPQTGFRSHSVVDAGDGTLRVSGELEAAGKTVPLDFDATVRAIGDELEIEATTTVDHRLLGMTWSPLGAMRSPSRLHVKARLT
jgi:polyisoprenoid-binding protein YceI